MIPKLVTVEQLQYIKQNIDLFKTNTEIAVRFNLTRKQISDILYTNKIRRSYTNQGRVNYNKEFFSAYSKLSCYWAGFIAADGCISSRKNGIRFLTISLKKEDEEHLKYFIQHIDGNNLKIVNRTVKNKNGIFPYVSVILYSDKICDDLQNNFNIYKNKTKNLEFPVKVPKKFLVDFIRGFIDGDGCLSITSDKRTVVIRLSYVGRKTFINMCANALGINFYIHKVKNKEYYIISYSSINSIFAIVVAGYFNKNNFCLERKRNKLFLVFTLLSKRQLKNLIVRCYLPKNTELFLFQKYLKKLIS